MRFGPTFSEYCHTLSGYATSTLLWGVTFTFYLQNKLLLPGYSRIFEKKHPNSEIVFYKLTLYIPDYTDIPSVLLKHLYKLVIQFSGSQGGLGFLVFSFVKYSGSLHGEQNLRGLAIEIDFHLQRRTFSIHPYMLTCFKQLFKSVCQSQACRKRAIVYRVNRV